jgi:hypothetical protein
MCRKRYLAMRIYQRILLMKPISQIANCEKLALHTRIIAETVDKALDEFDGADAQNAMDRVLAIGALLSVLREQKNKAKELTGRLPSPNQVSPELAEDVSAMGMTIFNFIEQCSKREDDLFSLAEQAMV